MDPIEIETLRLVEENMGVRINVENIFGSPPDEEDEGEDTEEEEE